jgi:hypothetical protein
MKQLTGVGARRPGKSTLVARAFVEAIKKTKPGQSIVLLTPGAAYILELKEIKKRGEVNSGKHF